LEKQTALWIADTPPHQLQCTQSKLYALFTLPPTFHGCLKPAKGKRHPIQNAEKQVLEAVHSVPLDNVVLN